MKKLRILVVDDNQSAADALARVLSKKGDSVQAVYNGNDAIQAIQNAPPDLVLTDMKMEPVDGLEVLKVARAQQPPTEVIVFTGYGAIEIAVKAMRLGARDFLTKPVTIDQLLVRLDQIRHGSQTSVSEEYIEFSTESQGSKRLFDLLRRAADVPSPVWIEGEIGSGRAFSALTIHRHGSDEGSFHIIDPGSTEPWPDNGTALLPNVDDLPEELQRRLHRRIQHAPEALRLIATASADARKHLHEGTLRPELYYALAVIVIHVPPLRERHEDVLPLIEQALDRFSLRYGRPRRELRPAQAKSLQHHRWPGNIRELLNLVERAVVLGADAFDIDVAPHHENDAPELEPGFSLSSYLESVERRLLVEALARTGSDRSAAGQLLGVERNTLRYKLNKYGLLDK